MKGFFTAIGAIGLMVIGPCMMGGSNTAFCEVDESNNWVCVGPCAIDAACGPNCVCVGASTGVGTCMSR